MPKPDRYLILKATGICSHCGSRPSIEGQTLCERCRTKAALQRQEPEAKERDRQRSRTRFKAAKETGICIQCHAKPAVGGKKMCAPCAQKASEAIQRRKELRLMEGLCYYCGKEPRLPNKTYGQGCQSYFQAAHQAQSERRKQQQEALKSQGICILCKKRPAAANRVMCEDCLSKQREYHRRKTLTSVQRQVMKRDGMRCVLCGIESKLVVHHIDGQGHTRAENPDDSPSNLITLCSRCHACITHLTTQTDRSIATYLILSARL